MGTKKKVRYQIEVAAAYGINPWELTPSQLHYMYLSIPKVKAQKELVIRAALGELSESKVYNLVYALTEDEDIAQQEVAKHILETSKRKTSHGHK